MKKLLFGALALTVLATACKKKDDNGTPANSFSIDGKSYSLAAANSISVAGGTVTVAGTNGTTVGGLIFSFPGTTAPVAGNYKIVNADSIVNANQVSFVASSTNGTTVTSYESTGTGTINATVTVDGGKLKISLPDAPAKLTTGTTTVNVKANVNQ